MYINSGIPCVALFIFYGGKNSQPGQLDSMQCGQDFLWHFENMNHMAATAAKQVAASMVVNCTGR